MNEYEMRNLNNSRITVTPVVSTTTMKPVTTVEPVTTTQVLKPVTVTSPAQSTTLTEILAQNAAKFAKKGENATNIFMGMILVIGFITFFITWNIDQDLQDNLINKKATDPVCTSTSLRTSNKIAFCLSTILIVFPITYFFSIRFGNCIGGNVFNYKKYIYIVFVLGIILTILGGIIAYESAKVGCNVKAHPEIIWIMGVLITLTSIGVLFYTNKKT
jgi:hypothetical protein